jgi:hypothetical protein
MHEQGRLNMATNVSMREVRADATANAILRSVALEYAEFTFWRCELAESGITIANIVPVVWEEMNPVPERNT